jgi:hypothetical protein
VSLPLGSNFRGKPSPIGGEYLKKRPPLLELFALGWTLTLYIAHAYMYLPTYIGRVTPCYTQKGRLSS